MAMADNCAEEVFEACLLIHNSDEILTEKLLSHCIARVRQSLTRQQCIAVLDYADKY